MTAAAFAVAYVVVAAGVADATALPKLRPLALRPFSFRIAPLRVHFKRLRPGAFPRLKLSEMHNTK